MLVGIALFLTIFVMAPTFNQIKDEAFDPLQKGEITQAGAFKRAESPMREFMFNQTREKDLALFVELAKLEDVKTRADVPTYVLIPAFVISELKTAFQIGFLIFLPFLIIDLVVASTLMCMGMMMLPPVFISLPFKILLFVLVDGWNLVTRSLVESFYVNQDVVINLAMQAMQLAFKIAMPLLLVGPGRRPRRLGLPGRDADPGADAHVHPEDRRDRRRAGRRRPVDARPRSSPTRQQLYGSIPELVAGG